MSLSPSHCLTSTKLLLALALGGSVAAVPAVRAQAQSLLSSNQVVVTRVESVNDTTILISGINFDKFRVAPVVSLSGSGTAVTPLAATYSAATKDITALLPDSVARIPGTYRLMVSFGSGTAGTDVFEFTVGAVGPKGEKGEKGDTGLQGLKGDKGDKGETGAQGLKGDKGDKGDAGVQGPKGDTGARGEKGEKGDKGDAGPQGVQGPVGPQGVVGPQGAVGPVGPMPVLGNLPVYQNVTEARNAGIQPGQLWVQDSSGQVFQLPQAR